MRTWQILDVGSIWMKEFASALSEMETTIAWEPDIRSFGAFENWQEAVRLENPPLEVLRFPLQRGYARDVLRWISPYQKKLLERMQKQAPSSSNSPLICTTPFYAPVAELWPGPVIYYVTDLTVAYPSLKSKQVRALDVRMCHVARAVCPNSKRIADYLTTEAHCNESKITVIPNATRASNIAAAPQYAPEPLPDDVADLPRPVIGVLGMLSGNMNWELIAEAMKNTSTFSWVFVGPSNGVITNKKLNAAREWVKTHARFVGLKPYGELQTYARCFDAAVLPYMKKEPTYSGSSTRFYEHLAAGRPMIATRGFAELLEKEPLVTLVDTAAEMISALNRLHASGFQDGHEVSRWNASKSGTWKERARTMRDLFPLD